MGKVRVEHSSAFKRVWLAVAVIALCGFGAIGYVLYSKRANTQRTSPEQERIRVLTQQLASLTQMDLIVFPDGRVWYVRSVHGKNLEVVGWINNNTRSEDIGSFVHKEDKFTIVGHADLAWPMQRDRFFGQ